MESNNPVAPQKKGNTFRNFFIEVLKFTLIAVLIVVPFRFYVAQPFVVNGASMDPTFESGQYLIVDQLSYKFEEPKRGSVIIFRYPNDKTKFFIKRIIGLPKETVKIKGTEVTIENTEHPEGFKLQEKYVSLVNEKEDNLTVTLEDHEYFVMGDNRLGSSDSRIWGPIKDTLIIGRPFLRLFPISKVDFLPGYEYLEE